MGVNSWSSLTGVAERFAVPLKPGNAGGGKGPQFKTGATRGEGPGDWATYQLRIAFRNCRRRCTRKRRQNPATASTLYDKISRDDILAHACAQCRSNRGASGVDRQDFEAVEAYGVERWLGEPALALWQETHRPEPIRRVYIPKANGKLRPLGMLPEDLLEDGAFAAPELALDEPPSGQQRRQPVRSRRRRRPDERRH